jgi:hypothetical protein
MMRSLKPMEAAMFKESKVAYAVPSYSQPPRIKNPLVGGSILWAAILFILAIA